MNTTQIQSEAAALVDILSDNHSEYGTEDGYDCGTLLVKTIQSVCRHMEPDGADCRTTLALAEAVREITTTQTFISTEPEWGTPGWNPAILTALHNLGVTE